MVVHQSRAKRFDEIECARVEAGGIPRRCHDRRGSRKIGEAGVCGKALVECAEGVLSGCEGGLGLSRRGGREEIQSQDL